MWKMEYFEVLTLFSPVLHICNISILYFLKYECVQIVCEFLCFKVLKAHCCKCATLSVKYFSLILDKAVSNIHPV